MDLEEFVATNLPASPSRILEVGCGAGDLARALADEGHDVVAIDPQAPDGAIFRKVSLEDFSEPADFDAVVASTSLHHIPDLSGALAKIRLLLSPGGSLILNEFGWERLDERTARWCVSSLRPSDDDERSADAFLSHAHWVAEHEGLHTAAAMRLALDASFTVKLFEWVPFLAEHELERPDLRDEEAKLIESGDITAIGFRYVGTPL